MILSLRGSRDYVFVGASDNTVSVFVVDNNHKTSSTNVETLLDALHVFVSFPTISIDPDKM